MNTINFLSEFAPGVAANEKTLALLRERKDPARHADVGEFVELWTDQRTRHARRLGVGLVILRAIVRFKRDGIGIVSDVRAFDALAPDVETLHTELLNRESDTFARRSGFENYAALWAWHVDHLKPGERKHWRETFGHDFGMTPGDTLCRQLVAWRPLNAEQIAQVDAGNARLESV